MYKINFNGNFDHPIIQNHWKKGFLPHFAGIVIGDGNMISMQEKLTDVEGFSEYCIYSDHESTIDNFIAHSDHSDHFVDTTTMINRVYIPEINCDAICGEGQMGNEGFVALVKGESLIWSAFFTISNPFYDVTRIGDFIIAKSTHDIFWEFPITEPWKARVLGPSFSK